MVNQLITTWQFCDGDLFGMVINYPLVFPNIAGWNIPNFNRKDIIKHQGLRPGNFGLDNQLITYLTNLGW